MSDRELLTECLDVLTHDAAPSLAVTVDPRLTPAEAAAISSALAAPSEDIETLRRENKRLRGLLTEAQKAVWMNYDGDLLDRIEAALKEPAIQPAIQPAIRARRTLERLNDAASQSD